jgi:endonuclease/exonuclease/phosphatase family metal-dependent hydrolase
VRIASFNLENLKSSDDLEARGATLRPQLERLGADVLCLQEIDGVRSLDGGPRRLEALDVLLERTTYSDFHRATSLRSNHAEPRDRHNLVVLSRWPIAKAEQFSNDLISAPAYSQTTAMPPEGEQPVRWDRPILHVVIEVGGGHMVHIVNVHLKAPLAAFVAGQKLGAFEWKTVSGWAEGFFLAAMKRTGQALEVRVLVDRIFDDDPAALIVLCGDFNAEERDVALRIVAGKPEDTGNDALTNRELVPLEHSLPEPRRFTLIHGGRRLMLDHILASRPLLQYSRGIEVHNESLGDELAAAAKAGDGPESFHAPVVATFALPGSESLQTT